MARALRLPGHPEPLIDLLEGDPVVVAELGGVAGVAAGEGGGLDVAVCAANRLGGVDTD